MIQRYGLLLLISMEHSVVLGSSSIFLRALSDQEDEAENQTDPVVFWSVNAFILMLLVTVCSWLWCCDGYKRLTQVRQTDLHYAQILQQRNAEREARRQMSPQERQVAILQSLRRNQVRMVRIECCFCFFH